MTTTPKTLIISATKPSVDDLAHVKCTWVWKENDNDLLRVLATEDPDVLVTVSDDGTTRYAQLNRLPLAMRKSWLHFATFAEIADHKLMYCMMHHFSLNAVIAREKQLLGPEGGGTGPLISIFTTSFKSKHRIQRPLTSIFAQTWTNWEWVIIDDTDEAEDGGENWKQLQEIASRDYRIRAYKPHKHSGVIGSLKRDAAMLCRGQLLVELDHDDLVHRDTFSLLARAYSEHPDAGMFWTDYAEVMEETEDNWSYGELFSFGFGSYSKQLYEGRWRNRVHTSPLNCMTMRHIVGVPNHLRVWSTRAYLEMGGHSAHLHVADDYELILRTFLKYKMVRIPKLCYIQYRNAGGNNFTFIRNKEIQKLTKHLQYQYDDRLHERFLELGLTDSIRDNGGAWYNKRSWLAVDDGTEPQYFGRADILFGMPERSLILCVQPSQSSEEITTMVRETLNKDTFTKEDELIVVGCRHPTLDGALSIFGDERLQWWNLQDDANQSETVARSYGEKMIATGKVKIHI